MKTIASLLFYLLLSTVAFGQYITVETIDKALKKEVTDLKEMANTIVHEYPLDQNGGFTYVLVVEAPGQTKEQLYITLNAWLLRNFDGKGILINDKDLGCIMAHERLHRIAANGAFASSNTNYEVDIEPTIRADIKDGKVRITYNVPCYELKDVTSKVWGKQAFKKN